MTEELLSKLDLAYTRRLLEDMIRIDSIVGNEGELADYLKNEVEALGLKGELDLVEPGRSNIYARLAGNKPGKRLNFNGHMDTVPVVDGWDTDPFTPVIKDGKIFGLGACDMKAGIACSLNMLRAFIESNYSFNGELSFSGVIDEEAYGKGAKAMLLTDYAKVDAIVIPEPYPGDGVKPIPLGITGKILYDIIVKGKAAHGFRPHLGLNAIEELGIILANLHKLDFKNHPDFGRGNYSTLKIEGGYKDVYSVVVPASARMEVNRLLVPGETVETAIEDMERLVESLDLTAEVEVKIKPPQYEAFVLDRDEPIIRIFDTIYRQIMGHPPLYEYTSGITDANIFSGEANIPCLHLGPPQEVAHQKNEFVLLDELLPLSQMFTLIASKFLGDLK
ncbi:MAG: M20 family metallopeptidase [Candidatus Heimdallarchaeota archaeon]|nr:MAG: M20 family metallopeptidase [Candidatus Heimdallarchaeota archaeon]